MSATAVPPPRRPDQPRPSAPAYRWRWVVLAVVLVAEIMDLLDSTVITIAAPTVRAELGGGTSRCSGGRPATRSRSASC